MGMLVDAAENALLALLLNNTNYANIGDATGLRGSTVAGSLYIGGHTTWPGENPADQTVNEATYTGYARAAVARSTSGFTAPSGGSSNLVAAASFGQRSDNGAAQNLQFWTFGVGASGATGVVGWGVFGDATFQARPFMVLDASTDLISIPSHGLVAGDRVAFFNSEFAGSLPAGITEGTVYFVIGSGLATDVLRVSTTLGGSTIDITGTGSGIAAKIIPIQVTQNITPSLGTSTLIKLG